MQSSTIIICFVSQLGYLLISIQKRMRKMKKNEEAEEERRTRTRTVINYTESVGYVTFTIYY